MRFQLRADEWFGPNGPLEHLKKKLKKMPKAGNAVMHEVAHEVVATAKKYVSGEETSYWGPWDPLWVSEDGPGPGKWTPEFNKQHRRVSRDNDNQPLFDSGEMYDAIQILGTTRTKDGAIATVGIAGDESIVGRAWKHEYGGYNPLPYTHNDIPERPFMRPAIEAVHDDAMFNEYLEQVFKEYMRDNK
jgi:hypothetical protein